MVEHVDLTIDSSDEDEKSSISATSKHKLEKGKSAGYLVTQAGKSGDVSEDGEKISCECAKTAKHRWWNPKIFVRFLGAILRWFDFGTDVALFLQVVHSNVFP